MGHPGSDRYGDGYQPVPQNSGGYQPEGYPSGSDAVPEQPYGGWSDGGYAAVPAQGGYRPTQPFERGWEPSGYPPGGLGGPPGPAGPGSGGPGGGGPDGGDPGGGNRTAILIAVGVVCVVLVVAIAVVLVVIGQGGPSSAPAADATTTAAAPTATSTAPAPGITLPSGLPSITIPPIPGLGGASPTAGAGDRYTVQVTGSGSAQLIAVGVPNTNTFGTQTLPWSLSFTSSAGVVSITVLGFQGTATCSITRNGAEVTHNSSTGGVLMCNSF